MSGFRFAVLGTGGVSEHFCRAAGYVADCEVCAVSSRRMDKAEDFAARHRLPHAYGDCRRMLETERPDCAYIGVVTSAHFELALLCLELGVPVLCEKAMCRSSAEAEAIFRKAREKGLFVMEAMWSRFLPAIGQAKAWLEAGRIGKPCMSEAAIGFMAPSDPANRYFNPALGGGAAYDLLVYAYELTTHLLGPAETAALSVQWGDTGVDVSETVTLRSPGLISTLAASLVCGLEERLVIYGTEGRIVIPRPHFGSEACLYGREGQLIETYRDTVARDGFTYEIEEAMRCIRAGEIESPVVPHRDTLACARLFDRINDTK